MKKWFKKYGFVLLLLGQCLVWFVLFINACEVGGQYFQDMDNDLLSRAFGLGLCCMCLLTVDIIDTCLIIYKRNNERDTKSKD